MRLINTKDYIAQAAQTAAKNALLNHHAAGYNYQTNTIMAQLCDLIALAVGEGIREALNNMYTDEEFEKDLTLKP